MHRKTGFLYAGIALSLAWLGGSYWYVSEQYGLANIEQLLPHEVGVILTGVATPLLLLWLLLSLALKREDLAQHTAELRQRLAELTFSGPDASRKVASLAVVLRDQTEELRRASEQAARTLGQTTDHLRQQTSALEEAAERGVQEAEEASQRLGEERRLLSGIETELKEREKLLIELMNERTESLGRAAEEIGDRIVKIMDQALMREGQLRDSIRNQSEVLDQVAAKAGEKLSDMLNAQADLAAGKANAAVVQMVQSTREIQAQLSDQAQKMINETRTLTDGVITTLGRLGDDLRNAALATKADHALLQEAVGTEQARLQETAKEMAATFRQASIRLKGDMQQVALETSRQIDEMTERMKTILGEQREIIDAAADARGLSADMNQHENSFAMMLAHAAQTAKDIQAHLSQQAEEYQKVLDRLNIESQVIGSVFRVEANSLNEAAERATGKAGELQESVRQFGKKLEEETDKAKEGWHRVREDIEIQSDILSRTTAQHLLRVEELKSSYAQHAETMDEVSRKTTRHMEDAKTHLSQATDILQQEASRAIEKQENIALIFAGRAEDIERISENAHTRFGSFAGLLSDAATQLKEALQESSDKSSATLDAFREASESLTQVARKTAMHLGSIKLGAEEQITDLNRVAAQMNDIAQKLREDLHDQSQQFVEAAKQLARLAREESGATAGALTANAEQVSEAVARMAEQSRQVSQSLMERIEQLDTAVKSVVHSSSGAGDDFARQALSLASAIEKAADAADGLGDKFRAQSLELAKTAEFAFERMEDLARRQNASSKDAFLRAAGSLVEELNSLALDMHNLLDNEIPEEIWRRYRDGDKAIFARRLFKMRDHYFVPAIQQRYEGDDRFRAMVDRYMDKFEDLFGRSGLADPDAVLSAAFITADVGKLYLVIARSLGRKVIH